MPHPNSRAPETLASVVSTLGEGVTAGTPAEAADANIVVVAVPWANVHDALAGLKWNGQIVIDATNNWNADDLETRTSSEVVADLASGAHIVKAGNTLAAEVLASNPGEAGGRRVIFISGDNGAAKAAVVALFEGAGFSAIDLGDLATGGLMQQIHHPLSGIDLIRF